jgi:hypothetical protein
MPEMPLDGFAIELLFDKRRDGRFHVHSPSVPGLHLAGCDLQAIKADIEPVLRDLLLYNSKLVVDRIEWHPSLAEVITKMTDPNAPAPAPEPRNGAKNFLLIFGHAA